MGLDELVAAPVLVLLVDVFDVLDVPQPATIPSMAMDVAPTASHFVVLFINEPPSPNDACYFLYFATIHTTRSVEKHTSLQTYAFVTATY